MALSGGPSSWLALDTLLSLHAPGNQQPGKAKVRVCSFFLFFSVHLHSSSLTAHQFPFELGVVHVQEQAATATIITEWMHVHAPHVPLHIVNLHDALSSAPDRASHTPNEPGNGAASPLDMVHDVTAREDLQNSVRRHLLFRTARQHGYGKLVLGDTSSMAAVQVIAAACKGQGNVLPTLVAPYDARYACLHRALRCYVACALSWGASAAQHCPSSRFAGFTPCTRFADVVVLHPMQSVSAKEASLLARRLGLPSPPPPLPHAARRSINQLAEAFVMGMQRAVPSAVSTITKTAAKLHGYDFTAPPTTTTAAPDDVQLALCSLCCSPLHASERAGLCRSCLLGLFGGYQQGDEEAMGALAGWIDGLVRPEGTWNSPETLRAQVDEYLL